MLVLACTGCGRLAFDEREIAVTPDGTPDMMARTCTTLEFDQFPSELTIVGGTIEIANGQIRFEIPGDLDSEAYVELTTPISFVGRSTAIQAVSPSMTPSASTGMGWHEQTGQRVGVHLEMDGTNLKLNRYNPAADEYTEFISTSYDAAAHVWWRLREENALIIAEVSTDGVGWDLFGTVAGIDVTSMTWDIGLGAYVSAIAPSESTADNAINCVP